MRPISENLKKRIMKIPRRQHHGILHHIHKKHKISKETLFYMKEYGPKSNLIGEILKDSIPVLLLSAIIALVAGLYMRSLLARWEFLIPLLIMIPALNDMIGALGSTVSARFTTGLFLGKIKGAIQKSGFVKTLLIEKFKVAIASVVYLSLLALAFSAIYGFQLDLMISLKIILIGLLSSVIIVGVVFLISVVAGVEIFKKGEDPNNFLIPMSTSIADLIALVIVTALALLLI